LKIKFVVFLQMKKTFIGFVSFNKTNEYLAAHLVSDGILEK